MSMVEYVHAARTMANRAGGPQSASDKATGDCTGRWLVRALVARRKLARSAEELPGMPTEDDLTLTLAPVFRGLSADEVRAGVRRFVAHNDRGRFPAAWNTLFGMARRSDRAAHRLAA